VKVYVLIPMVDGMVREVSVHATEERAEQAEKQWLREKEILDEKEREEKSDWGTGVAVWECEVEMAHHEPE